MLLCSRRVLSGSLPLLETSPPHRRSHLGSAHATRFAGIPTRLRESPTAAEPRRAHRDSHRSLPMTSDSAFAPPTRARSAVWPNGLATDTVVPDDLSAPDAQGLRPYPADPPPQEPRRPLSSEFGLDSQDLLACCSARSRTTGPHSVRRQVPQSGRL